MSLAASAGADEITFSFVFGSPGSLAASNGGGLSAGRAIVIAVSDADKGIVLPFSGFALASTGPATSWSVTSTDVTATFSAGGVNSLQVLDLAMSPVVLGTMEDGSTFDTTYPNGVGSLQGLFDVSFVDPAVLALFGLGPSFLPEGSVSYTFAHDNLTGGAVTGEVAAGTVTIETPVPEPGTLALLGSGVLGLAGVLRRKTRG
jgi:hypothetical protein